MRIRPIREASKRGRAGPEPSDPAARSLISPPRRQPDEPTRHRQHRAERAAMTDTPADFGRTPPHDVTAEQCVLGGMLLSKDAISDVIEVIRPADHYRPAHQLVHEAILDLYGRGEPVDAITVADLLTRTGQIGKIGNAA